MDRNSITGLLLIFGILALFWWMNKPSDEEMAERKRQLDSINRVEQLRAEEAAKTKEVEESKEVAAEEIEKQTARDSARLQAAGILAPYIRGKQEFTTLENEEIKVTLSNLGGRIYSVELKQYETHDGKPLILFEGDNNRYGFNFTYNTNIYNTNDLYFDVKKAGSNSVTFEITGPNRERLAMSYSLTDDVHMVEHHIDSRNLGNKFATPRNAIDLEWTQEMPAQEKGRQFEQQYSGIYYKFFQDEVDDISGTGSDSEDLRTPLKWIAFKDQFFSSILISDDKLSSGFAESTALEDENSPFLRFNKAEAAIPFDFEQNDDAAMRFFFGPNHFYTLNSYEGLDLHEILPLGWGIFGWINRYVVIPVFNFLDGFIGSYGIIILVLTIMIKVVLFPLTYKSYMSTAKMRVLKPQIDEINEKIPKDKAMERQQATMALYRKAGVNPMGGCLPMLLQMPILIAMFRFFPSSIELRQESFLWATDLSTYDSIVDLPFNIPFYGDHVSLFTLLMAVTNIFYTRINQEMTQSSAQMPGMKGMMYMMPVMFLFFFNQYASGLSYYYFVSTLITIGQTVLIRQFVDEKAILAKLKANQKKPAKKSKFQARLEEMQKQQAQVQKGKGKKPGKKK
ncbi:membrane protein insertase YidC [Marinilabilia rubra]|uniref:Membrane protein insertase YidC n=1 Tax=Marinilabilia rubra TaxID=2162893 RepID=A0A2U2B3V4_9BACT|nr:membrane protein insertase YidC [Marinilabilia rubra]PWD97717.1 membrane protein insertase YidC [Marinilabilia rubra]